MLSDHYLDTDLILPESYMHTPWIFPAHCLYCPSTVWILFEHCLNSLGTPVILSEYFVNPAWFLPKYRLITGWILSGCCLCPDCRYTDWYCLITFWIWCEYCLNGAWLLPDYCLDNSKMFPEHCLYTACILSEYYLSLFWILPEYCLGIHFILLLSTHIRNLHIWQHCSFNVPTVTHLEYIPRARCGEN